VPGRRVNLGQSDEPKDKEDVQGKGNLSPGKNAGGRRRQREPLPEKGIDTIYTPGGNQQLSIINEPGLYSLILRTITKDGEPWFVAKDVAEVLGYTWNGNARIAHVPPEWRGATSVVTPSGTQNMSILSE